MLLNKLFGCLFICLATVACESITEYDNRYDCTYIHPYGLPVGCDQWAQSGSNGQRIVSWRDGVTVTQTYADGLLHGESTYTYPHCDQKERVELYCNNDLASQVFFSMEGAPTQSVVYLKPNTKTITIWYDRGNPRSVETYDGERLVNGNYYTLLNQCDSWVYKGDGERIQRNELGHFVSYDTFQNGFMTLRTTYYQNCSPREIACYNKCGQLHGERKTYYEGGEPMAIEQWDHGMQSGITVVFQHGEKVAEVPYVEGRKDGIEKRYIDGSTLVQEATWKDNLLQGPTYTYECGQVVNTDWFYKGRRTSRANYDSYFPKRLSDNCES